MGALFSVPIYPCNSITNFISWNRKHNIKLYGSSSQSQSRFFRSVEYTRPLTLVFGNERQGITNDLQEQLDLVLSIPMVGRTKALSILVPRGCLSCKFRATLRIFCNNTMKNAQSLPLGTRNKKTSK